MYPPDLPSSSSFIINNDALESTGLNLSSTSALATMGASFITSMGAAVVTQTASLPTSLPNTAGSKPDDDENSGECKLLGSFAVFVQAALGALALLSLVYKRWRERPQRPIKVWAFDASKQVVGSILLHLANVIMAMFSAGQIQATIAKSAASAAGVDTEDQYQPNPCSWYLLNLAIDTTVGIAILIAILKVLTVGASYTPLARPLESIRSGHYGNPPKTTWWLKQCLIYFMGLIGMKSCVFLIFQLCPWLGRVGDWALRWTEGNEAVQIAFVMFIFPLIMNAMQYYIIDTFIKNNQRSDGPSSGGVDGAEDDDEQGGLLADGRDHGHSIDEDEACKDDTTTQKPPFQRHRVVSYDPDKDGETLPQGRDREVESSSRNSQTASLEEHAEGEGIEDRPRV
ncbi:uncharacterized protein A1O9_11841 [Exophiala aquamarina CBS 119918]|uniref:Vacuolar membrane protein n=1 Tax=Exophiala aquamarina CBS 119918 TaxID=1182545 RepID=A0A072NWG6_9EURO|nr:uncharacterized protein A1O9_11841 [Exophiala aquamarina CBS 119918]KEF52214.1 hypothetical protein A1O9_11841 [Exophiala aquamarina CBS 119918]